MQKYQKISMFLLRISMGWLFFYAGITKVLDSSWSAAGYLGSAKLFGGFYDWLASPGILPITNFVNEWGLTILGICLILGVFVRVTAILLAIMMFLYFLPLGLPMPNAHSYIVDEHVVYIFALLVMSAFKAGDAWGLDAKLKKKMV